MNRLVTVVTGGSTPERDVALAGAAQVVAALRSRGFAVNVVDTTSGTLSTAEVEELSPLVDREPPSAHELAELSTRELGPALVDEAAVRDADVVFLVLHGRQGEGGQLQALLELAGIPFTGSSSLGSALAMDKDIAKRLFSLGEIPTAPWAIWPATEQQVTKLGFPLVVKPSKAGSTVGLSVVESIDGLHNAVATAQTFDDEVILERYISGRELTVGILRDRALTVGEIIPEHGIFDYECKYTPGMSQEIFPADVSVEQADQVRRLALRAHRVLKLRDFSRVDFLLADDNTPYCLEANTLPGFTATSLFPQSAQAAGVGFAELCETLCDLAQSRAQVRNKMRA